MEIYVDDETKLTLHGLVQHYIKLTEAEKNRKLNDLLDALMFNQVVIFVKSVQRCTYLDKLLTECNFPSIAIHRGMSQGKGLSQSPHTASLIAHTRLTLSFLSYQTSVWRGTSPSRRATSEFWSRRI